MSRAERPAPRRRSPSRPDLLRDGAGSPLSPFYRSFFEDECRTIAARLLVGSAATPGPSPGPAESGAPWPPPAAPLVTSTPFESSPPPAAGSPPVAALLGRPRGAARRLASPRAGGRSRLARPQPRRAGQLPPGRPPARSPRRAAGRPSPARPRASVGPEPRGAGKGPGAPAAKLPAPPGAKLKAMPAAKSGLQHPTYRASQLARPSAGPKAPPRDRATETAGKAGGRRQPPQRIPTSIPTVASRSRLQPAGKAASSKRAHPGRTSESTPQEPVCNRTRELMENDKADQTWVCVGSPYLRELHPGPVSGCGDAACAAQPAGCQLSQELEHVKKELERVKGELADKTAQCEAYCQTISSLQAQLRAAVCLLSALGGQCSVLPALTRAAGQEGQLSGFCQARSGSAACEEEVVGDDGLKHSLAAWRPFWTSPRLLAPFLGWSCPYSHVALAEQVLLLPAFLQLLLGHVLGSRPRVG